MLSRFLNPLKDISNKVIVTLIASAITGAFLLFKEHPLDNMKWLFIEGLDLVSPTLVLIVFVISFYNLFQINLLRKKIVTLDKNEIFSSPEFEFAERITLRKIYNGPNSSQASNNPATSYALSVRVGITNHEEIRIFDTKMTLCLVRYDQIKDKITEAAKTDDEGNILYERHGIEEFTSGADYVRIVHRFSFPIKDLSYLTISPVMKRNAQVEHDRIEIIFSGFYGANSDVLSGDQIKKFVVCKKYKFTDIKFANRTEKVTTYTSLSGELYPKTEWSNFKQEPYKLNPQDYKTFEEELKKILMQKNSGRNCLIIGGGLSGLVAATHLQSHGFKVKVLDKGRGIGGRLATRRINHPQYGEGIFDYGVQYITAKSEDFKKWLDELIDLGIVDMWACASKSSEDVESIKYRGVHSTRSIAKHLASNLDVRNATKVVDLNFSKAGWTISADDGSEYYSSILIMTAPLPQSVQLLRDSNVPISETSFERLSKVHYNMCLAVLMIVSAPIKVNQAGSCNVKGEKLDWITCNHQKGVSPNCYAVTLHGTAKFSEQHYDRDKRDLAAQELIKEAEDYLGEASIIDYQVHVWRYSTPITQFDEPFFSPQKLSEPPKGLPPLYLAGDAFSSRYKQQVSSLESAFLSGLEVAKYICEQKR